jgi:6,7-dimethyl-8-ribityllumazine synthase
VSKNILIVESRYYEDVAEMLFDAVCDQLKENNFNYKSIEVLGALEIPIMRSKAIKEDIYDGFIALGCVIKGETSHYDIVSSVSAHSLSKLAIKHAVPITNGILTVDNKDQALYRADTNKKNIGGHAAKACMNLIESFNSVKLS